MTHEHDPSAAALYLGLISGTSRDGLDVALVDLSGDRPQLRHARCVPYPPALRNDLDRLLDRVTARGTRPVPKEWRALHRALGRFFAEASLAVLDEAGCAAGDLCAIGSHGQTLWHEPGAPHPLSLQIGDAALLADITGCTVVSNFRQADLAAGGEGAPLAPLLHRELFLPLAPCAVLNLGGIANLTLLGSGGELRGFDTGPANCLMDAWCQRHQGAPFDRDGAWAETGEVLPALLARLLETPYFEAPPPKSTGLELFNGTWLDARLEGTEAPADVQRTLLELTVTTVASALQTLTPRGAAFPANLLVCGGGVHNRFLLRRLRDSLGGVAVESTERHGVHPDWVEATLFAWLARERLAGRNLDTGSVTGARSPVRLGDVTRAPQKGDER